MYSNISGRACKDDAELPIITGYGCDQSFTKDHEVSLETTIPAKHEEHKVKKKENSLIWTWFADQK